MGVPSEMNWHRMLPVICPINNEKTLYFPSTNVILIIYTNVP